MRKTLSTLLCGAALTLFGCKQQAPSVAAAAPPAVPVSVAKATQESVPTDLRVVGTAEASSNVQVKSQIAGELVTVNFKEGQNVQKGDLLFRIDDRPYKDALSRLKRRWTATAPKWRKTRLCWLATTPM